MSLKISGVVKSLINGRYFGFVRSADGTEYFFHRDDFYGHWDDLMTDNERGIKIPVEFEVVESPKGPRAANVKRTDFPNEG